MTVACARVERGSRSGKTVGLPLLAFMGPLSRFFGGGYERNLARFWNRAYCVCDDLPDISGDSSCEPRQSASSELLDPLHLLSGVWYL